VDKEDGVFLQLFFSMLADRTKLTTRELFMLVTVHIEVLSSYMPILHILVVFSPACKLLICSDLCVFILSVFFSVR